MPSFASVTLILPLKEKGLIVPGQRWLSSNEILPLTPQNDKWVADAFQQVSSSVSR